MAANTSPIFSKIGSIQWPSATPPALKTAESTTYTGVDSNDVLCFTADATNGSFVQRIRFKAVGTNVATVARIYINNGSTNGTNTNNSFYGEVSLPATTASASSSTIDVDYPMNVALPAGYKIYIGLGTTVSAGWVPTVIGGTY